MKKIVVLTGAGISAESGIKTFRDSGGLWEEHRVEDVATFEAWLRNPRMVLEFYNQRRKQLYEAQPNAAHFALTRLEQYYDVRIVTQNIDDLHERGGSTRVLHLHGELKKARSTFDPDYIVEIDGWELKTGDKDPQGYQLRPHVVWFGEAVPMIERAIELASEADIFLVIGTSLNVYPAANLVDYVPKSTPKYLVDPKAAELPWVHNLTIIRANAGRGVPELVDKLIEKEARQLS